MSEPVRLEAKSLVLQLVPSPYLDAMAEFAPFERAVMNAFGEAVRRWAMELERQILGVSQ